MKTHKAVLLLIVGILLVSVGIWGLTHAQGHGRRELLADETDMYTLQNGNIYIISYNSEVSHMILSKYANADYKTKIDKGDSVWLITLPKEKKPELKKMFAD